jgi:hypothetical protein
MRHLQPNKPKDDNDDGTNHVPSSSSNPTTQLPTPKAVEIKLHNDLTIKTFLLLPKMFLIAKLRGNSAFLT